MYFDLEFCRAANPGLDGQALVDKLVRLVQVGVPVMVWQASSRLASVPAAGDVRTERSCVHVHGRRR
jgi:hypothetical protein